MNFLKLCQQSFNKDIPIRAARIVFILVAVVVSFSYANEISEINLKKAAAYIDQESYKNALKIYKNIEDRLDSIDSIQKSRIFNNIGFCAFKLKLYEEAEVYYRRALLLNDVYITCLNNLGVLLIRREKYIEAQVFLQKAYDLDNKNIKVIINLAVCCVHRQDKKQAIHYISEAFSIDERYTRLRLKAHHFKDSDIFRLKEYINLESKKVL